MKRSFEIFIFSSDESFQRSKTVDMTKRERVEDAELMNMSVWWVLTVKLVFVNLFFWFDERISKPKLLTYHDSTSLHYSTKYIITIDFYSCELKKETSESGKLFKSTSVSSPKPFLIMFAKLVKITSQAAVEGRKGGGGEVFLLRKHRSPILEINLALISLLILMANRERRELCAWCWSSN